MMRAGFVLADLTGQTLSLLRRDRGVIEPARQEIGERQPVQREW
jgi:hypothetical protein